MKITMYSNFMNHHQLYFCKGLINELGDNFKFVATEEIDRERLELGYLDMNSFYEFVIEAYKNESEMLRAEELARSSDVVIIGSAPFSFINNRVKEKKLTFVYSERLFKKGLYKAFNPARWLKQFYTHTILKNRNVYLLAASAYAPLDYSLFNAYKNRMYQWGYFPEVNYYSEDSIKTILDNKTVNELVWVGRMITLKHCEEVLFLAKELIESGFDFKVNIIGVGELLDDMILLSQDLCVDRHVIFHGSMSPENVRLYMERSSVFLFTSDFNEGWGAVLNEAMNSLCAVVASHAIGSVPFLLKDGHNGYIYENGNRKEFHKKVKSLLLDNELCKRFGLRAYKSISEIWSPSVASKRIIELSQSLLDGEIVVYEEGPCKKASIINQNYPRK